MTYRVIIQSRAERDIQEAARRILDQSRSTRTALRWARGIRAKIATLKSNPQRCPIDPASEVYGDTVHVLTVRHSAQRSLADEMAEDESEEGGEAAR